MFVLSASEWRMRSNRSSEPYLARDASRRALLLSRVSEHVHPSDRILFQPPAGPCDQDGVFGPYTRNHAGTTLWATHVTDLTEDGVRGRRWRIQDRGRGGRFGPAASRAAMGGHGGAAAPWPGSEGVTVTGDVVHSNAAAILLQAAENADHVLCGFARPRQIHGVSDRLRVDAGPSSLALSCAGGTDPVPDGPRRIRPPLSPWGHPCAGSSDRDN